MRESIGERLDRRIGAREAQENIVVGAADVVELARIVFSHGILADERIENGALEIGADHRAVLRCDIGDIGRHQIAAGSRHVLRHDGRIAGHVLAEETRHQPRISVIAAAGRRADDDGDRLAPIELRDRILRRNRQSPATGQKCRCERGDFLRHGPSSLDSRGCPSCRRRYRLPGEIDHRRRRRQGFGDNRLHLFARKRYDIKLHPLRLARNPSRMTCATRRAIADFKVHQSLGRAGGLGPSR